jgi:predicted transcriptional regulator
MPSTTIESQQQFLRIAIAELGLTRKEFSARIGCAPRTLEKWLLPLDSQEFRTMPEPVRVLIREIRAHEILKASYAAAVAAAQRKKKHFKVGLGCQ